MRPTALSGHPARLARDVESGLAVAAGHVGAITAGSEAVLALLPASDGTALRGAVTQLRAESEDTWAQVHRMLSLIGDPAALHTAARGWSEHVVGPISGLIALPTLNTLVGDDHWTGPAADAYRNTLPAQVGALTTLRDTCDQVAAGLHQLAEDITDFWKKTGIAVNVLLGALLAASATATTVVGAPLAVAAAIGALAAFIAAIATAVDALSSLATAGREQAVALQRRLNTDTVLQGGWPRSTTPVSTDAVLLDGDDTDWHLRR